MIKDDYYFHYPKRTQLLDSDCEIKPDKWQMDFDGIRLIGVGFPVFQNMLLVEDEKGGYKVESVSNRVSSSRIAVQITNNDTSITSLEMMSATKEIWNFLWKEISKPNLGSYVADGIFIYSISRVVDSEFYLTSRVYYTLRWAPKITYKDVRILRNEKLEQILYDEEI